jgi:[ribosomal protein S18]-alanine N-acetyltransferase
MCIAISVKDHLLTKYRIEKIKEYDSVKLISVRTSQLTFKFYKKFGFNIKEIIKNYWADGFDLYSMEYVIKEK